MPSSVVVADTDTLIQNLAENSKMVLCNAALGAGTYALGGALLGFPPTSPAAALVTGGALMTALTLCPANANGPAIFGRPANFSGGQCPVVYDFNYSKSDDVITEPTGRIDANVLGPITAFDLTFVEGVPNIRLKRWSVSITGAQGTFNFVDFAFTAAFGSCSVDLVRNDNLPDNCGNPPVVGGQIIRNNTTGDTINNSTVIDNRDYSEVVPITFDIGGIQNTLNLQFGPIKIGSLLPLNFNINIGGSDYKFRQKPDGGLEPVETNPDPDGVSDRIQELLKEIKTCVCGPAVDLDMLLLPIVSDDEGCAVSTETLLVPKGSVSDGQFQRFVKSAQLAELGCESRNPVQLPEDAIFSASTTMDGRELFTGLIEPDVVSLILRITEIRPEGPEKLNLYEASNQRKFGSVAFVTDGVEGGGDYIYVFDQQTYIPLPRRGKNGRLRILMKKGLSFTVYDSGERL